MAENRRNRRRQHPNSTIAAALLLDALASSTSLIHTRRRPEDYGLGVRPPPRTYHDHPFEFFEDYDNRSYGPSFIGFFPWIKRLVWYFMIGCLLLVSSLCLYGVFYKLVMPSLHASEKLHFDYHLPVLQPNFSSCRNNGDFRNQSALSQQCSSLMDNSTTTNIPPSMDTLQTLQQNSAAIPRQWSSPRASGDLFSRQDQWIAHQEDVIPHPKSRSRVLPHRVPHFVELLLYIPESQRNLDMGMFEVSVQLHSSNGTLLASSLRSSRMPHESHWIAVMRKFICLLPILLGALHESRQVLIPCFRNYVESEQFPLRYVTVSLIMPPEKEQRGEFLEVSEGYLHIGKELTDFQMLLKEYFFTSLMIGTTFFYGLQVLLWLTVQSYRVYLREKREQQTTNFEEDSYDIGFGVENASDGLGLDDTTEMRGGDGSRSGRTFSGLDTNNNPASSTPDPNEIDNHDDVIFFECTESVAFGEGNVHEEGEWEDLPTTTNGNQFPPSSRPTRIPDHGDE